MTKKKQKKNYYFTKDTENAILEYIECPDPIKKNKLYNSRIDFAFFKLTQNIINTYKFPYMDGSTEDKQQECIVHLLEQLHKYKPDKGAAYSYFGTAVLRYCINKNKKAYNKLVQSADISCVDEDKSLIIDMINEKDKTDFIINDEDYVINSYVKYVEDYIDIIFDEDWEKDICDTILILFKQKENLEIFNKKAIFLHIRERTNQSQQKVTKVIKKLKKVYERLRKQFDEFGFISPNF